MIQGWGSGVWGFFKWGGESDAPVYNPTVGVTLTLISSATKIKNKTTVSTGVTLSILPTFEYARGMRTNISLSLLPSNTGIKADYTGLNPNITLSLVPSYKMSLTKPIEGITLSLISSAEVTPMPTVGVTLSLIPQFEYAQTINKTGSVTLSLLSSYSSIVPSYQGSSDITLRIIKQ
jgi:hypothetical protein